MTGIVSTSNERSFCTTLLLPPYVAVDDSSLYVSVFLVAFDVVDFTLSASFVALCE
jgi:hypothetical protein